MMMNLLLNARVYIQTITSNHDRFPYLVSASTDVLVDP